MVGSSVSLLPFQFNSLNLHFGRRQSPNPASPSNLHRDASAYFNLLRYSILVSGKLRLKAHYQSQRVDEDYMLHYDILGHQF